MWQFADIGCFQLTGEMRKPCPENRGDLLLCLGKLAELLSAWKRTHRIGVVAQKATNPWSEPNPVADHLEDVDGEEEHQGDGHTHEAVSGAVAFKFRNE